MVKSNIHTQTILVSVISNSNSSYASHDKDDFICLDIYGLPIERFTIIAVSIKKDMKTYTEKLINMFVTTPPNFSNDKKNQESLNSLLCGIIDSPQEELILKTLIEEKVSDFKITMEEYDKIKY